MGACRNALAQPAPINVTGNWIIYSTSIEDGTTVVKHVEIAQDGTQLSGYFEGPDQTGPINGEVKGHHIHFVTVTRNVLNFRGEVIGNTITGTYGLHGRHAQWQAQREPGTGAPEQAPVAERLSSQPVLNTHPADQLDALVAPIALYPDALVAQVLASAESPNDVTAAHDWLAQNASLAGDALSQAVAQQPWDASVKSLTQFPSVLANMAANIAWTTRLGQAYATQQPEVMAAVQTMRARAYAAGNLQSNSQITVAQQSPSTIVIQPANPQVVYVPQYNPALVYGAAVVLPAYYVAPPVPVASVGLFFGDGVSVAASVGSGWGWHGWGLNWWGGGGGTVIYNNTTYINNNNHWSPRRYPPYDPNYRPGQNTNYGPHGHYHDNGYFGPNGHFHPYAPGARGVPNGGANGNRGLIGGNGSTQHLQPLHEHPEQALHEHEERHGEEHEEGRERR
ncbi:MAG: DUF3300 domain-containing protein [Proteobacteria bacterium]|nr:DUF3300 domain-containing protein [Pseudomonadota bacterium]